ncbi:hypothetical protein [uncultured Sphingomonas sp.]|uniref:hypothetical protein n=1 Tax=uncultured Sphingomonas sp. TaxID=158754 RepID=UPI0025D95B3C|nr:hypothetical protein [uncultured Sphingomonas sp.]
MTAVIKRHNSHHAAIGRAGVCAGDKPAPLPDPLQIECERLTTRVADLERRIVTAQAAAKQASDAARAEGYASGFAAADRREDDRLEALTAGIAASRAALSDRLNALDGLAAALAHAALAKMFAAPCQMAEQVVATIARNIDLLRAQAAQRIVVSAQDFDTPDAVVDLCNAGVSVEISDALVSGECRADCRLGSIDLSVSQQWAQVAAMLDDMAGAR